MWMLKSGGQRAELERATPAAYPCELEGVAAELSDLLVEDEA
jgi:hypothetical protein